jgi:hypothetical protein
MSIQGPVTSATVPAADVAGQPVSNAEISRIHVTTGAVPEPCRCHVIRIAGPGTVTVD